MSRSFFWENIVFDLISRLVHRVIVRGHAVKDIFILVPVQWSVVGRQRDKAILWSKKFRPFLTDSASFVSMIGLAKLKLRRPIWF